MANDIRKNKATREGLHIRCVGKRVDNYAVYELYNGNVFIVAAHGPSSLLTVALMAERLSTPIGSRGPNPSADWILWE